MDFALREWRQSDAAGVAKYANNGKIARNLRDVFPHPYTLTDAEYFVNSCLEADQDRRTGLLAGGGVLGKGHHDPGRPADV